MRRIRKSSPGAALQLSPALQRWAKPRIRIRVPEGRPSSPAQAAHSTPWKAAAFFWLIVVALSAHLATAAELAILSNGFTIRHEHHVVMGATTRLYLAADDSSFTDVPTDHITGYEPAPNVLTEPATSDSAKSARAIPLNQVVKTASATYHLDPDLVNSVIHAESGFNPHAVSPKGARGLMQLMPATANQLGVNDAFDPQANVDGGSRYLRELLERYDFDLVKALAAYNAGPLRVEQYQGVPPFRETRAYVARIVHDYNTKKIAQEKEARRKQIAAKPPAQAHPRTKPVVSTVAAESSR
jgi:soluble lytic murein transglycosylase-like protein